MGKKCNKCFPKWGAYFWCKHANEDVLPTPKRYTLTYANHAHTTNFFQWMVPIRHGCAISSKCTTHCPFNLVYTAHIGVFVRFWYFFYSVIFLACYILGVWLSVYLSAVRLPTVYILVYHVLVCYDCPCLRFVFHIKYLPSNIKYTLAVVAV